MGFLEEKLSNSQTREFIVSNPFAKEDEKKTRVIELTKVEIEHIFKKMRPRNLDYEAFRDISKILQKELAQYLKGELVHVSKVSDEVWADYTKDMKVKPKQRGNTYKKDDSKK